MFGYSSQTYIPGMDVRRSLPDEILLYIHSHSLPEKIVYTCEQKGIFSGKYKFTDALKYTTNFYNTILEKIENQKKQFLNCFINAPPYLLSIINEYYSELNKYITSQRELVDKEIHSLENNTTSVYDIELVKYTIGLDAKSIELNYPINVCKFLRFDSSTDIVLSLD